MSTNHCWVCGKEGEGQFPSVCGSCADNSTKYCNLCPREEACQSRALDYVPRCPTCGEPMKRESSGTVFRCKDHSIFGESQITNRGVGYCTYFDSKAQRLDPETAKGRLTFARWEAEQEGRALPALPEVPDADAKRRTRWRVSRP